MYSACSHRHNSLHFRWERNVETDLCILWWANCIQRDKKAPVPSKRLQTRSGTCSLHMLQKKVRLQNLHACITSFWQTQWGSLLAVPLCKDISAFSCRHSDSLLNLNSWCFAHRFSNYFLPHIVSVSPSSQNLNKSNTHYSLFTDSKSVAIDNLYCR